MILVVTTDGNNHAWPGDEFSFGIEHDCIVVVRKLEEPLKIADAEGNETDVLQVAMAAFPLHGVKSVRVMPEPEQGKEPKLVQPVAGFRPPPDVLRGKRR